MHGPQASARREGGPRTQPGRPKRSLGQNFLRDRTTARRIVSALDLSTSDSVLEVGPGRGALTGLLAERAGRLCAVEMDDVLAGSLTERFSSDPRVTVVCGDALTCNLPHLNGECSTYKMVGNLPFNIASAVIRRLLTAPQPPTLMVVMVQREVAEAMTAAPGDMTYLSVEVQLRSSVRRLFVVPPSSFRPTPRVHSAVVSLVPHSRPTLTQGSEDDFLRIVRAGFAARRKQLRNSLGQGLGLGPDEVSAILAGAQIDGGRRPQTLSIPEWSHIHATIIANAAEVVP